MEQIESRNAVDDLLRQDVAIVFKHSTMCSLSARAHDEVMKFLDRNPGRSVYKVHVIEDRSVSDYLEDATGIRHASPQILVLRAGEVTWTDSHFGITAGAIEAHLA